MYPGNFAMLSFLVLGLSAFVALNAEAKSTTDWKKKCEAFTALPTIPESISASLTKVDYYAAGALFNETDPNTSLTSTRCARLMSQERLT
jgi:hypothetical protein